MPPLAYWWYINVYPTWRPALWAYILPCGLAAKWPWQNDTAKAPWKEGSPHSQTRLPLQSPDCNLQKHTSCCCLQRSGAHCEQVGYSALQRKRGKLQSAKKTKKKTTHLSSNRKQFFKSLGLAEMTVLIWHKPDFSTLSQKPVGDAQAGTGWGKDASCLKPSCSFLWAWKSSRCTANF